MVALHPPAGIIGPLRPIWRDIATCLAPVLHPASLSLQHLTPSILVTGAAGSGKTTAVAAAAAALGLHFLPWSCHDIKVRCGHKMPRINTRPAHVVAVHAGWLTTMG